MTEPTRDRVVELLTTRIAPEFTADEINDDEDLREQLDIDSMDIHQFAVAIYETFGVDVPETDRSELTTVSRCVRYLNTPERTP